ncbi:MAG TPA: hypothetical protein VD735_01320 [Candidatus Saccharimonadales bacterium]|nr:hypothetical protein [Candidatus Saccharimonadales bacterium]
MLYLQTEQLRDAYFFETLDADVIAAEAARLTANTAEVVPPDLLVRQPELPVAEQITRADALSQLLRQEVMAARAAFPGRGEDSSEVSFDAKLAGRLKPLGTTAVSGAWLDDVAAAIVKGWPVEMEGPVVDDVQLIHNSNAAAVTRRLGGMFRRIATITPNVRPVVTVVDETGAYAKQLSQVQKDTLTVGAGSVMLDAGILLPGDTPGKEVSLIRSSQQLPKAEAFTDLLASQGAGKVYRQDGALKFKPQPWLAEKVVSADGSVTLTRQLGDGRQIMTSNFEHASTFFNPHKLDVNRQIVHFNVDSMYKMYARQGAALLLRASDLVGRERNHTLIHDYSHTDLAAEGITYETAILLGRHIEAYRNTLTRFTPWTGQDPYEYAARNFTRPTDEEAALIPQVITVYRQLGLQPGTYERAIDIGPGSNLYSAMLTTPFAKGKILLREYAQPNRDFMNRLLSGQMDPQFAEKMWPQFADLMAGVDPVLYNNAYQEALARSVVEAGSIFDLAPESCDWLQSIFVIESIVKSKLPFWQGMRIMRDALRQPNPDDLTDRGGILTAAFIIGSEGWPAGDGTHFPAASLSMEEIGQAATDAGLEYILLPVGGKDAKPMRKGYKGVALMVAWRRRHND